MSFVIFTIGYAVGAFAMLVAIGIGRASRGN